MWAGLLIRNLQLQMEHEISGGVWRGFGKSGKMAEGHDVVERCLAVAFVH